MSNHPTGSLVRRTLSLAAPCILSLSVSSLAKPAMATTPAPTRIAAKGVIVYCSDLSYPPLEYFDAQTNQPVGFDVEFGQALAAEMGVKADYKNITFDGLIPAIQAGQCDAIRAAAGSGRGLPERPGESFEPLLSRGHFEPAGH